MKKKVFKKLNMDDSFILDHAPLLYYTWISNDYNPFKRIESMPGSKEQKGDITDAVRPTI